MFSWKSVYYIPLPSLRFNIPIPIPSERSSSLYRHAMIFNAFAAMSTSSFIIYHYLSLTSMHHGIMGIYKISCRTSDLILHNDSKSVGRFVRYTSFLLPAINFARTQGDSWWVQQTVRAKSNACFPNVLVSRPRPVKGTPRPWPRPPIHRAARRHPVLRRCRGSRKHHPWPEHQAAAGVAAKPAHSFPRTIPMSPEISAIHRDVPYLVANEVRWV